VDKPRVAFLLVTIVLVVMLFTFQNCGSESKIHKTSKKHSSRLTFSEVSQRFAEVPESPCWKTSDIQCLKRVFSPSEEYHQIQATECLNGTEECLEFPTHFYNTMAAYELCGADCSEADIEPGGQFNYVEYFCYNQVSKSDSGEFEFEIYASEFETAVSRVIEECLLKQTQ
jgi:hypothetical protein